MNFEKLYEASCRIDDIKNNDEILIGGSYPGKLDLTVTADIDKFEDFFQIVEKNADNITKSEKTKLWLNNMAPGFDMAIFAHMSAFDNVLRIKYPNLSSNLSKRKSFYNPGQSKLLSQAVEEGVCMCAEISVLAQVYLQRQGLKTKYFGGELLRSDQDEFGEPHSFIELKIEKEDYFYDPASPTPSSGIYIPKISSVEATPTQKKQFENKIHTENNRRNCAFLAAKDIITKSTWYYGCGDGGNIFPSFIISKNNPQPKCHSNTL